MTTNSMTTGFKRSGVALFALLLIFLTLPLQASVPVGTLDTTPSTVKVYVIASPSEQRVKTHPMKYDNKISIAIEGRSVMGDKDLCIITPELAAKQMIDLVKLASQVKSGELNVSCDVDANSIAQSVSVSHPI